MTCIDGKNKQILIYSLLNEVLLNATLIFFFKIEAEDNLVSEQKVSVTLRAGIFGPITDQ